MTFNKMLTVLMLYVEDILGFTIKRCIYHACDPSALIIIEHNWVALTPNEQGQITEFWKLLGGKVEDNIYSKEAH